MRRVGVAQPGRAGAQTEPASAQPAKAYAGAPRPGQARCGPGLVECGLRAAVTADRGSAELAGHHRRAPRRHRPSARPRGVRARHRSASPHPASGVRLPWPAAGGRPPGGRPGRRSSCGRRRDGRPSEWSGRAGLRAGPPELARLVDRSINTDTYQATPRSNLFQRNTTGEALNSAMPFRMRSLSSSVDLTRMCRRKVRAILEKAHSIRLSQEPCLGV